MIRLTAILLLLVSWLPTTSHADLGAFVVIDISVLNLPNKRVKGDWAGDMGSSVQSFTHHFEAYMNASSSGPKGGFCNSITNYDTFLQPGWTLAANDGVDTDFQHGTGAWSPDGGPLTIPVPIRSCACYCFAFNPSSTFISPTAHINGQKVKCVYVDNQSSGGILD